MDDKTPLSGGVIMADQPPPEPPAAPPVAPAVGQTPPTTVVIPPETSTVIPETPVNPFIPQATTFPSQPQGAAGQVPKGGSPLRRILMILILALLIGGLIWGGRLVLGLVSGPKEATLVYWGLWENETVVRSVIADFEAQNPKIKVEYLKQSPRQYRERLQAAIGRGEGPDVFRFHNTWVAMLRAELAQTDAKIIPASILSNSFYPVVTNDLGTGSAFYGIPIMIDGLGLYYNEDLLAAAGGTPPTTWPELLELVPKLTVKNESGITTSAIALGTANNVEHFSDIVATMLMQNGANLTELSGKEAEETLIFYRKFADPSDPVYTWNETLDNSIAAFANSRVAMIIAPSWRAFDIKNLNPNLRFKIAPIPQLPGNNVTWASYWVEGVSAKSKYQKEAWQFVKYLTSREAVTKLYTEAAKTRLFGEPYALKELEASVAEDPYVGAYVKQAPNARSFPLASRTFDNGINDKLIKYLEDAINGLSKGSAPSAVLQTAGAGFRQVLGSYGLSSSKTPAAGTSP